MTAVQVLVLVVTFTVLVSSAPPQNGWSKDSDEALPAEALYMSRESGRASYRYYNRPGSATRTHSCNYVRAVPSDLRPAHVMGPNGLPEFYQKYTEAYGIPVLSSGQVHDDALKRACYTLRFILADSAAMRNAFYKMSGRVALISKNEQITDVPEYSMLDDWWNQRARGLGATTYYPISTGAEENALCMRNIDRWAGDDIVLHEYLHGLHALGANRAINGFEEKMKRLYAEAKRDGRWKTLYAMSTEWEYFAETGQSYLNSHISVGPPSNGVHNHIATREQLRQFDRVMHDIHKNEIFTCNNKYIPPCEGNKSSAQRRAEEHAQVLRMDCDGTS